MAGAIVTRTISALVDQRLSNANSPAARRIGIGNAWNTLRIGFRLAINDPLLANITSTPVLFLGVCSGLTAKYGDLNPTHALGIKTNTATWTRTAGPPDKYGTIDIRPVVNVAGAETLGGVTILNTVDLIGTPSTNRTAWVIEIIKGSPNFSINGVFPTAAQVAADISFSQLKAAIEAPTLANVATALSMTQGSSQAIACNEANGSLDSVCFYWNRVAQQIENSDVILFKAA
jgi:hypothetical protein